VRKRFGKILLTGVAVPIHRIAEFAGCRLDYAERTLLTADGRSEQLSRRLFATLALLLERSGRLVDKQELMRHVWADVVVEENTLSRTISSLRRKLGEVHGADRFIATVSGVGYRFLQPVVFGGEPAAADAPRGIAVLPFEDFSPQQDQRYFADGLVDELISALTDIPALRIIARTSVFQLRGAGARAAGQRLGVGCVVTGAVRKEGELLRVSVQLVDAGSERQLWAAQRNGREQALFALQEEVSRAVRAGLAEALQISDTSAPPQRTPDAQAYDLLLRARALAQQTGAPALMQTYALLKQALARDPDFALAWATLSVYARALTIFGMPMTNDIVHDIEQAAERTMQLEPDWWPAHVASCSSHHLHRDWQAMEQSLRRARELAPGLPAELDLLTGGMHLMVGRVGSAARHYRDLVGSDPLSLAVSGVYQLALHMSGDEAGAQLEYDRSLGLQGDRDMVEHVAIHRLWAQGLPIQHQLRRYLDHQSTVLPVLREIETVLEQPDEVMARVIEALPQPPYAAPARQLILGWWLARYGACDAAMDVLWRVYVDGRYINTSWLWFPVLAPLRRHARFTGLLERIGLARYWRESATQPELPGAA
jgi:TolB-like protein